MSARAVVTQADELRSLIARATQEDLADGGRYFSESCQDLTRCTHGDMGRYDDERDGELIEWLWNRRSQIADALACQTSTASLEAENVRLREALREARPYVIDAILDDGGIDQCEITDRATLEQIDLALDHQETTDGK